jgi:hypothetical protein
MESLVIKRSSLLVLLCVLLAGAAGCSKRHHIQIESDTCWTGTVNGDQYINDCGSTTYTVVGTLRCVKVRRTTPGGTLRLRVDDHPWVSSEDQYGIVQACD